MSSPSSSPRDSVDGHRSKRQKTTGVDGTKIGIEECPLPASSSALTQEALPTDISFNPANFTVSRCLYLRSCRKDATFYVWSPTDAFVDQLFARELRWKGTETEMTASLFTKRSDELGNPIPAREDNKFILFTRSPESLIQRFCALEGGRIEADRPYLPLLKEAVRGAVIIGGEAKDRTLHQKIHSWRWSEAKGWGGNSRIEELAGIVKTLYCKRFPEYKYQPKSKRSPNRGETAPPASQNEGSHQPPSSFQEPHKQEGPSQQIQPPPGATQKRKREEFSAVAPVPQPQSPLQISYSRPEAWPQALAHSQASPSRPRNSPGCLLPPVEISTTRRMVRIPPYKSRHLANTPMDPQIDPRREHLSPPTTLSSSSLSLSNNLSQFSSTSQQPGPFLGTIQIPSLPSGPAHPRIPPTSSMPGPSLPYSDRNRASKHDQFTPYPPAGMREDCSSTWNSWYSSSEASQGDFDYQHSVGIAGPSVSSPSSRPSTSRERTSDLQYDSGHKRSDYEPEYPVWNHSNNVAFPGQELAVQNESNLWQFSSFNSFSTFCPPFEGSSLNGADQSHQSVKYPDSSQFQSGGDGGDDGAFLPPVGSGFYGLDMENNDPPLFSFPLTSSNVETTAPSFSSTTTSNAVSSTGIYNDQANPRVPQLGSEIEITPSTPDSYSYSHSYQSPYSQPRPRYQQHLSPWRTHNLGTNHSTAPTPSNNSGSPGNNYIYLSDVSGLTTSPSYCGSPALSLLESLSNEASPWLSKFHKSENQQNSTSPSERL